VGVLLASDRACLILQNLRKKMLQREKLKRERSERTSFAIFQQYEYTDPQRKIEIRSGINFTFKTLAKSYLQPRRGKRINRKDINSRKAT